MAWATIMFPVHPVLRKNDRQRPSMPADLIVNSLAYKRANMTRSGRAGFASAYGDHEQIFAFLSSAFVAWMGYSSRYNPTVDRDFAIDMIARAGAVPSLYRAPRSGLGMVLR